MGRRRKDDPVNPGDLGTVDPLDQVQRCLHCPLKQCIYPNECNFRKYGIFKNMKGTSKPDGYSIKKMKQIMKGHTHVTVRMVQEALGEGTTKYAAGKWLEYYKESMSGNEKYG